jgi:hypothetical protein
MLPKIHLKNELTHILFLANFRIFLRLISIVLAESTPEDERDAKTCEINLLFAASVETTSNE